MNYCGRCVETVCAIFGIRRMCWQNGNNCCWHWMC